MSHVMACWRREWQAHRTVLLTLIGLLTSLAPLVYFVTPRTYLAYGGFELRLVAVDLGVVLVAVAAGLMVQRSSNALARRLPGGLARPLTARLVFFFTLTVGAAAWGLLCSWVMVRLFPARMPQAPGTDLAWYVAVTWIIAVSVGLWIMLVSSWLRSPLLSLPGTAMLLGTLAAPFALVYQACPLIVPTWTELGATGAFVLVTPLLATTLACTRGLRFRAEGSRRIATSAMVVLLTAMPLWGWAGIRAWRWFHVTPLNGSAHIAGALIGADTRYAYVSIRRVEREGSGRIRVTRHHALRVDLQTGAWFPSAERESSWTNVGAHDAGVWVAGKCGLHPLVLLQSTDSVRYVDGATGQTVGQHPRGGRPTGLEDWLFEARKAITPWRMAPGKKAWIQGSAWHEQGHDENEPVFVAPRDLRWGCGSTPFLLGGIGIGFLHFDPWRRRTWPDDAFPDVCFLRVRREGWLARSHKEPRTVLLEPETGQTRPAKGLSSNHIVTTLLDDGDALALALPSGPALRVDPETGLVRPIRLAAKTTLVVRALEDPSSKAVRTPGEHRIFQASAEDPSTEEGVVFFARLEADGHTVTPAWGWTTETIPSSFILACPDDNSAIILVDGKTIERIWFGSDRREILFPRHH